LQGCGEICGACLDRLSQDIPVRVVVGVIEAQRTERMFTVSIEGVAGDAVAISVRHQRPIRA
jgi:hypothetical protein